MSWVRIDDQAWDHPKHVAAGPVAFALWTWGLLYCSRLTTDGLIPASAVARSGVPRAQREASRLVDAGLWHREGDDYRVHDYFEYQPSREQVVHRRQKGAERLAEWRKRKGYAHGATNDDAPTAGHVTHGVTALQASYSGVCNINPVPVPVPVPVLPPNPLQGEEALRGDDDAAGWLCRSYPTWYAEERNGATYRMQPTLDWHAALGLTETWPDRKHLERMARTFLRATNLPAAHANRSLVTFARQYASACDAQVRAGGAA